MTTFTQQLQIDNILTFLKEQDARIKNLERDNALLVAAHNDRVDDAEAQFSDGPKVMATQLKRIEVRK